MPEEKYTEQSVKELLDSWERDPHWDLYRTVDEAKEEYGEFAAVVLERVITAKQRWAEETRLFHIEQAAEMGLSPDNRLYIYITRLENRLGRAEDRIEKLLDDIHRLQNL